MGNQTGSLKNPDELIKFLLPHLSYSKTLNDAPLENQHCAPHKMRATLLLSFS